MVRECSEIVDDEIFSGLWLQTSKPPWYSNFLTGSEFDLIILPVLAVPILVSKLTFPRSNNASGFQGHDGKIYSASSKTQIHFISGKTSWTGSPTFHELLASYPISELMDIRFERAHNTPCSFQFSDGSELDFYYTGVWSDLAEFKATTFENRNQDMAG